MGAPRFVAVFGKRFAHRLLEFGRKAGQAHPAHPAHLLQADILFVMRTPPRHSGRSTLAARASVRFADPASRTSPGDLSRPMLFPTYRRCVPTRSFQYSRWHLPCKGSWRLERRNFRNVYGGPSNSSLYRRMLFFVQSISSSSSRRCVSIRAKWSVSMLPHYREYLTALEMDAFANEIDEVYQYERRSENHLM
ncbi:MAG: hypothetical protein K0Q94_4874 [Paenibacillus sp.]|nr:hypothetical protein [Paenibacillus sp.]